MNKKLISMITCGLMVLSLTGCGTDTLTEEDRAKFKNIPQQQQQEQRPQQEQEQPRQNITPEANNNGSLPLTEDEYLKILESSNLNLKKDGAVIRKFPVLDLALELYSDPWWEIIEGNENYFITRLYQDKNNYFKLYFDLTTMKITVIEISEDGFVYSNSDAEKIMLKYLVAINNDTSNQPSNLDDAGL